MAVAWTLLLCVVVLIALNALFVAVEFAFVTVDRGAVQRAAESGDASAGHVRSGLHHLSEHLSGAQLGITVTSLIAGYIAEPSVGQLLQAALGASVDEVTSTTISVVGAFVTVTFFQMVFGELVPKNWAIAEPMRVSRFVVRPQHLYMAVFGWFVRFLNTAANRFVRMLGFEPADELASARTAEELGSVVRRSGREGTLDAATAELVARSIEFGDRTAGEVMMPRPRVTFLHVDDPVSAVISTSTETGHSRFPVLGEDVDDVVGVVHFKAVLAVPHGERGTRPIHEVMSPVVAVADSMTLDPLMRELRAPGLQVAVVVDEYGGTAGIVTLEDLIEEIVGEIHDEQDRRRRPFRRVGGGWLVSGLLRPDEVGDIVGLELPEGEETDTIGGLVTERLDRLPVVGDVVHLDASDQVHHDERGLATPVKVALRVQRLDGHRVETLLVRRRHGSHAARVSR